MLAVVVVALLLGQKVEKLQVQVVQVAVALEQGHLLRYILQVQMVLLTLAVALAVVQLMDLVMVAKIIWQVLLAVLVLSLFVMQVHNVLRVEQSQTLVVTPTTPLHLAEHSLHNF
jgi:hypothetical protein